MGKRLSVFKNKTKQTKKNTPQSPLVLMKEVDKSLATKLFPAFSTGLCPAWHVSGAQEPGLHTPDCCLPAYTMLPFHTKCSNEDTKNQKNHHLTRKCGGRMVRKREAAIGYSLLSPPCYGWSPLEKFALCRVGLMPAAQTVPFMILPSPRGPGRHYPPGGAQLGHEH